MDDNWAPPQELHADRPSVAPPPKGSELARLIAEGRVVLGTRNLADLGPPPLVHEEGPTLSEIFQDMRDEDDR